jgi:hypothetical protein
MKKKEKVSIYENKSYQRNQGFAPPYSALHFCMESSSVILPPSASTPNLPLRLTGVTYPPKLSLDSASVGGGNTSAPTSRCGSGVVDDVSVGVTTSEEGAGVGGGVDVVDISASGEVDGAEEEGVRVSLETKLPTPTPPPPKP